MMMKIQEGSIEWRGGGWSWFRLATNNKSVLFSFPWKTCCPILHNSPSPYHSEECTEPEEEGNKIFVSREIFFFPVTMWKKIFEKRAFLLWSRTSTWYDIYRCKRNDDILRIELLSDYKSEISRSCKFKEHLKKKQNAFYMHCFKLSDLVESIFPLESKPTIRTLDVKKQIQFFWHQKYIPGTFSNSYSKEEIRL